MFKLKYLLVFVMIMIGMSGYSKNIFVISPYLGPIENTYEDSDQKLKLTDQSQIKGLYFQQINPQKFQWNTFLYQSSDINYSDILGCHFIFDYYLKSTPKSKYVIGAGTEYIRIDLDADKNIPPFVDFNLTNNILIPYLRTGYYWINNLENIRLVVFPWAGYTRQIISGDIKMSFSPMSPPVMADIDEQNNYAMAGLNLKTRLYHFISLDGKYRVTFDDKNAYSTVSAMANIFFNRHIGFSYRFKYMQISKGSDLYHLFGLAMMR